ncbi:hypothetical protein G7Y89_g2378 [Cudoniella acicularis]|uniref:Uncharacterized protein n=1 Tax=Cudoniella acicularis TaxID=354080 RepID=A0A8H4RTK0_9HELO|nr:hypothetical protein G7Y89_g2378 [Cudoniella acicularis]
MISICGRKELVKPSKLYFRFARAQFMSQVPIPSNLPIVKREGEETALLSRAAFEVERSRNGTSSEMREVNSSRSQVRGRGRSLADAGGIWSWNVVEGWLGSAIDSGRITMRGNKPVRVSVRVETVESSTGQANKQRGRGSENIGIGLANRLALEEISALVVWCERIRGGDEEEKMRWDGMGWTQDTRWVFDFRAASGDAGGGSR